MIGITSNSGAVSLMSLSCTIRWLNITFLATRKMCGISATQKQTTSHLLLQSQSIIPRRAKIRSWTQLWPILTPLVTALLHVSTSLTVCKYERNSSVSLRSGLHGVSRLRRPKRHWATALCLLWCAELDSVHDPGAVWSKRHSILSTCLHHLCTKLIRDCQRSEDFSIQRKHGLECDVRLRRTAWGNGRSQQNTMDGLSHWVAI